jgi:probable addiction module antidote protein
LVNYVILVSAFDPKATQPNPLRKLNNLLRNKRMYRVTEFDPTSYFGSEEVVAEYLNLALASGDTDLLLAAIGDVAKARGMAQIARYTGLGRESLYKALSAGAKPRFDTVFKVLQALGVQMQAHPVPQQP